MARFYFPLKSYLKLKSIKYIVLLICCSIIVITCFSVNPAHAKSRGFVETFKKTVSSIFRPRPEPISGTSASFRSDSVWTVWSKRPIFLYVKPTKGSPDQIKILEIRKDGSTKVIQSFNVKGQKYSKIIFPWSLDESLEYHIQEMEGETTGRVFKVKLIPTKERRALEEKIADKTREITSQAELEATLKVLKSNNHSGFMIVDAWQEALQHAQTDDDFQLIAEKIGEISVLPQQPLSIALGNSGIYKKRIAILNFDTSLSTGAVPLDGQNISALITQQLVGNQYYTLVGQEEIAKIQQSFSPTTSDPRQTAVEIGRILRADAVIIGSVKTDLSSKPGISLGGIFGGSPATISANVLLNAQILDSKTGSIVHRIQASGSAEGKGKIEILGIGSSGDNGEHSLLETASSEAVSEFISDLVATEPEIACPRLSQSIRSGKIVDVDLKRKQVTLDYGAESGLINGAKLSAERVTEVSKNDLGKVIRSVTEVVGTVEIIEVAEGYSIGRIISGDLKKDDVIKE